MRGIETAFWGVLGKDPELRTSKTGNAFATMNVAVTVGKADDGKDISQWVRVACFGETAETIAAKARKGDRVYVEGQLTLNTWADKTTGETKTGLNVAAWRCEKVAAIGKNRERQAPSQIHGQAQSEPGAPVRSASGPAAAQRDFNDAIPF